MNKKEEKALKKQQKQEEKWERQYEKVAKGNKFKQWRSKRPFWGATLTVLAAMIILYIPLHLYAIAFIPGNLVFVGFLFGGLTLIIGVFAYVYPQFSTVFGVVTIFLSVLSIMGAMGGFVVGTILGIISGSLLIAWEKQKITADAEKDNNKNKQNKESKGTTEQDTVSTAQG